MGIRFRRSVKLASGVRLNLGTKSMSVRFGGRGFGVTVGTSGARVSVGIPGTGLYVTQRLAPAGKGRTARARSHREPIQRLQDITAAPAERGTQPPTVWAATAVLLALTAINGFPLGFVPAAIAGWVAWRGYTSPKYVALKQIRAARNQAQTDGESADARVKAAAAKVPDSWTVQREAAMYFVSRGDVDAALQYFANAIRHWPGDKRAIVFAACDVAASNSRYRWIIDALEPHAASLRPEESDLDAALLGVFALAHLEEGQAGVALELTKRLPLQRRNLTPPLLYGLCVRAMAKHALGQKAGAQRDLERVYAADPEFPLLQKARAMVDAGTSA